jgi:citrate lyase subunit beta / citryl-CoA lyase
MPITPSLRPRRSALYMPGSNARALEKAKSLPADVVILDLEDAVAPDAKAAARAGVIAAVKGGGYGSRELVVRINGLDSPWGRDDLAAAASAGADAVLVPKVSTPDDLHKIHAMLIGAPPALKVWAMMETPLGVLNARDIAAVAKVNGSRLACFIIGTNDLVKETRASLDENRTAGLFWLGAILTAAKAYGLDCLDGVYNDFKDLAGMERESVQGRSLGMDGKTLIHPDQIAVANRIFAPSPEELAKSQAIIAAFTLPENKGKGVITMDGRMVELLHAEMAKRTVAIAAAIAARS